MQAITTSLVYSLGYSAEYNGPAAELDDDDSADTTVAVSLEFQETPFV